VVAAAGPGGNQPGGSAFADQVAFELGQGGEDGVGHHRLPFFGRDEDAACGLQSDAGSL
jgi:hypothetical protein